MTARNAILTIAITVTAGLAYGGDFEILERWYGRGVHAYFAGNSAVAARELSRAIDGGSRDPRAYYFRGLAYLNMGRVDEAHADMAIGGRLETLDVDGVYPVSRSLERVQGASRQLLERYRRQATLAAFQREQERQRRRYETVRRREPEVLRQQVELRLDRFARPVSQHAISHDAPVTVPEPESGHVDAKAAPSPSPAPEADQQRDPFGDDKQADSEPAGKKRMAPGAFGRVLGRVLGKSLPTDQPARTQAKPAEKPVETRPMAEEDPFGEETAPVSAHHATETPTAPDETEADDGAATDPFGDDETAAADHAPPAADGKNPAEESPREEPPSVEEDPFGSDDAAPASDEDDPFGGS